MGALDRLITGAGRAPEPGPPTRNRLSWQKHLSWAHDLPPIARHVGLVIGLYTDDHAQQGVWLTPSDLARLTGVAQSTVVRYRGLLQQAGWVTEAGGAWFPAWPGELPITTDPRVAKAAE